MMIIEYYIQSDPWADSLDFIQEVRVTTNQLVQDIMNIRSFICLLDEVIIDSDEDLTDQIVAQC